MTRAMRANHHALRAIRERTGLSQSTVAAEVGMDRTNYAHLEAGRRKGTDRQLVEIARVLRVPVTAITHALDNEVVA